MSKPLYRKIALVGVGLIGGSIGLAVRKRKLAAEVVGIGRTLKTLRAAQRVGAVTSITTQLAKGLAGAELVVVCTPVEQIVDRVREAAAAADPNTLLTDAGSTKAEIVSRLELAADRAHWPRGVRFVGGHPIAGNERRGPQHGSADLFVDRTVVLTPSDSCRPTDVRQLKRFWQALGAKVLVMSAEEHDRAVAAISHLPHLIVSAIAAATPESYVTLSAGGWQDTTRVASADPTLWRQILLTNRDHVLGALGRFDGQLTQLRTALETRDEAALERLLEEGKRIRDIVGNKR